jgi:hypothetical protein
MRREDRGLPHIDRRGRRTRWLDAAPYRGRDPRRLSRRQPAVTGCSPRPSPTRCAPNLHPDHVGWTSRDGQPDFPNTTYRCHRDDWCCFVELLRRARSRCRRSETARAHGTSIRDAATMFSGIDGVPAPGRTPESCIVVLSGDSGVRAMLLGRIVQCPVELVGEERGNPSVTSPRNSPRPTAPGWLANSRVRRHFSERRFGGQDCAWGQPGSTEHRRAGESSEMSIGHPC